MILTLPIMGAMRRPFSWSQLEAYPVIQNLSFVNGRPTVSVSVTADASVTLQRNGSLLDAAGWNDVASTTATDQVIHLSDTNPVSRAVYYRVKQILGGTP